MNSKQLIAAGSVIATVIMLAGCKRSSSIASQFPVLPSTPYDYLNINESGTFTSLESKIKDGSGQNLSNASVTLGRVLFYDKHLSLNNTIACGSCHIQEFAFSDGTALSEGFANKLTSRSSMAILNAADNNNMFWDSRAGSPMELSLQPVFNHIEMGMESDEMLVSKLRELPYYPDLFQKAFGSNSINRENISLAITHFINSMYSKNSKFDEGRLNQFANFTPLEKMGLDLFSSSRLMCNQCHAGDNLAAPDFPGGAYGGGGGGGFPMPGNSGDKGPKGTANIGLDVVYKDNGMGEGRFKIPSLRNIALTAPYMHDGRFKTLDDVLDHYSHGIKDHPNLDVKFSENGHAKKLNLTLNERAALLAFFNTLSDQVLTTDPKFSNPFLK